MIEQKATVVTDEKGTNWLQAERTTTCSQCSAKKACGTGMLSDHVGKRFSRIAIVNNAELTAGQTVDLAIPERALLKGAFLVYILPLLAMFAFAGIANVFQLGDFAELILGGAGLLVGFLFARHRLNKQNLSSQINIRATEDLK